jgi:hypothetical protein
LRRHHGCQFLIESRWPSAGELDYHCNNTRTNRRANRIPKAALEEQINAWLSQLGKAVVIRSETVVTPIAEKPNILVTVWYEPQSN